MGRIAIASTIGTVIEFYESPSRHGNLTCRCRNSRKPMARTQTCCSNGAAIIGRIVRCTSSAGGVAAGLAGCRASHVAPLPTAGNAGRDCTACRHCPSQAGVCLPRLHRAGGGAVPPDRARLAGAGAADRQDARVPLASLNRQSGCAPIDVDQVQPGGFAQPHPGAVQYERERAQHRPHMLRPSCRVAASSKASTSSRLKM